MSSRTTDTDSPPVFSPVAAVLLAVLAASTASIFVRYAQTSAPSLAIAAWRMLIATTVLVPIALARNRRDLAQVSRRDLALIGLSGASLAVHFATWITSLAYTTVASSVVLVSIAPLFVALLSPALLRERIERRAAIGIGLAFIGVVVIAANDACASSAGNMACPSWSELLGGQAIQGDLLALGGAAAVAGYMLIGRHVRTRMALVPYITLTYGAAAVVLVAMTMLARRPLLGFPAATYGWIVLLALIPQLMAHSTYNWALKYLPAAFVSISLLGEPAGSTALAFVLLGETPSGLKLAGAALILLGIVLALRRPARPAQVQGGS
jgi:drug/metabolite transporter (DMT)-like permease